MVLTLGSFPWEEKIYIYTHMYISRNNVSPPQLLQVHLSADGMTARIHLRTVWDTSTEIQLWLWMLRPDRILTFSATGVGRPNSYFKFTFPFPIDRGTPPGRPPCCNGSDVPIHFCWKSLNIPSTLRLTVVPLRVFWCWSKSLSSRPIAFCLPKLID